MAQWLRVWFPLQKTGICFQAPTSRSSNLPVTPVLEGSSTSGFQGYLHPDAHAYTQTIHTHKIKSKNKSSKCKTMRFFHKMFFNIHRFIIIFK